jgi:hypothetical protein
VLLPLLVGASGGVRRHGTLVAEYLVGRLAGYLGFGFLVWSGIQWLPRTVQENPGFKGSLSLGLGCLMLIYGILQFPRKSAKKTSTPPNHSACMVSPWRIRSWLTRCPRVLPAALGLVSGLNLCPPFVVALTQGGVSGSLCGMLLFFLAFFWATALFFLPIPFVGAFPKLAGAAQVASFAGILVGLFFIYTGTLHLIAAHCMS